MTPIVRWLSGLVLLLVSCFSLSVSAQETMASLKDGYYFVKNARTAENALYIGRPRIPKQLPGAAFNRDPMRACWTFDSRMPLPDVFEDDALFFLFKSPASPTTGSTPSKTWEANAIWRARTARERACPPFPLCSTMRFSTLSTTPQDPNYVNLVSFKLLDRKNNAVSTSEHNNGVVMSSTADAGARWLLIPVDERRVHL